MLRTRSEVTNRVVNYNGMGETWDALVTREHGDQPLAFGGVLLSEAIDGIWASSHSNCI